MVDRTRLKAEYDKAVRVCLAFFAVPFLLGYIAWTMSDASSADGPGTGAAEPLVLAVLGIAMLSPMVTSTVVRALSRNALARAPDPVSGMFTWKIVQYAVWEVSVLLGFVGYIAGAHWWFFALGFAITLIGWVVSFPRWSHWTALADWLDAGGAENPIITT